MNGHKLAWTTTVVGIIFLASTTSIEAQSGFQDILEKEVQKPIGEENSEKIDGASSSPTASAANPSVGSSTQPDPMELLEKIRNAWDAFDQSQPAPNEMVGKQQLLELDRTIEQLDTAIDQATKDVRTRRRQLEILMTQGDARERSEENIRYLRDELAKAINRKKNLQRDRQTMEERKRQFPKDSSESPGEFNQRPTSSALVANANSGPSTLGQPTQRGPATITNQASRLAAENEPDISTALPGIDAPPSREQQLAESSLLRLGREKQSAKIDPEKIRMAEEYYRANPDKLMDKITETAEQIDRLKASIRDASSLMNRQDVIIAREKAELKKLQARLQELEIRNEVNRIGFAEQSDTDLVAWDESLDEINSLYTSIVDAEEYLQRVSDRHSRARDGISQLQRTLEMRLQQSQFLNRVGK